MSTRPQEGIVARYTRWIIRRRWWVLASALVVAVTAGAGVRAFLQTDQARAGNFGQGGEFFQRNRAGTVPGIGWTTLPRDADLQPRRAGQFLSPDVGTFRCNEQVGNLSGNRAD